MMPVRSDETSYRLFWGFFFVFFFFFGLFVCFGFFLLAYQGSACNSAKIAMNMVGTPCTKAREKINNNNRKKKKTEHAHAVAFSWLISESAQGASNHADGKSAV